MIRKNVPMAGIKQTSTPLENNKGAAFLKSFANVSSIQNEYKGTKNSVDETPTICDWKSSEFPNKYEKVSIPTKKMNKQRQDTPMKSQRSSQFSYTPGMRPAKLRFSGFSNSSNMNSRLSDVKRRCSTTASNQLLYTDERKSGSKDKERDYRNKECVGNQSAERDFSLQKEYIYKHNVSEHDYDSYAELTVSTESELLYTSDVIESWRYESDSSFYTNTADYLSGLSVLSDNFITSSFLEENNASGECTNNDKNVCDIEYYLEGISNEKTSNANIKELLPQIRGSNSHGDEEIKTSALEKSEIFVKIPPNEIRRQKSDCSKIKDNIVNSEESNFSNISAKIEIRKDCNSSHKKRIQAKRSRKSRKKSRTEEALENKRDHVIKTNDKTIAAKNDDGNTKKPQTKFKRKSVRKQANRKKIHITQSKDFDPEPSLKNNQCDSNQENIFQTFDKGLNVKSDVNSKETAINRRRKAKIMPLYPPISTPLDNLSVAKKKLPLAFDSLSPVRASKKVDKTNSMDGSQKQKEKAKTTFELVHDSKATQCNSDQRKSEKTLVFKKPSTAEKKVTFKETVTDKRNKKTASLYSSTSTPFASPNVVNKKLPLVFESSSSVKSSKKVGLDDIQKQKKAENTFERVENFENNQSSSDQKKTEKTLVFKKPSTTKKKVTFKKTAIDKRSATMAFLYPPTSTPFASPNVVNEKLPLAFESLSPVQLSKKVDESCPLDELHKHRMKVKRTYAKTPKVYPKFDAEISRWEFFRKKPSYQHQNNYVCDSDMLQNSGSVHLFESPPINNSKGISVDDIFTNWDLSRKNKESTRSSRQQRSKGTIETKSTNTKKWFETTRLKELANHFNEISQVSLVIETTKKKRKKLKKRAERRGKKKKLCIT